MKHAKITSFGLHVFNISVVIIFVDFGVKYRFVVQKITLIMLKLYFVLKNYQESEKHKT